MRMLQEEIQNITLKHFELVKQKAEEMALLKQEKSYIQLENKVLRK